jgi:hypothetical protein
MVPLHSHRPPNNKYKEFPHNSSAAPLTPEYAALLAHKQYHVGKEVLPELKDLLARRLPLHASEESISSLLRGGG